MHRWFTPAQWGFVHDIIMNQGEIMEELYGCSKMKSILFDFAEEFISHQTKDRPDSLS
jgi:hypothetical protein